MSRVAITLRPLSSLITLFVAVACGRSELYGRDHCDSEGASRDCSNDCGSGNQVCRGETWSDCVVARTERACTDTCGNGVATCEGGEWSACRVAPTERTCSDGCGDGTEACVDGRFQGCVVPRRTTPCSTVCGSGTKICESGTESACDAPLPGPPTWAGTARDFLESHPDFELPIGSDQSEPGLVSATLGDDGKPVYAGRANSVTTSGQANFDGWFHDVPGINRKLALELAFEAATGGRVFSYSGKEFFPLDGQLFGNEGWPHNYHFTYEAHADFDYDGGGFLEVEGDDDVWVFVNRRLAIDLGGLHEPRSGRVDLGAERERLGLERGGRYAVDLFFAERHTVGSSLSVRTSLTSSQWCP